MAVSERDLIADADASYFDWLRVWASVVDGGEARDIGPVLAAITGAPQEWWNTAAVTRSPDDPDGDIRRGIDYFDGRRQPFILRIPEHVDPAAGRAAEALGLTYRDTIPALVLDPIPAGGGGHPDLEIRTVADPAALADHVRVLAGAFTLPLRDVRALVPMRHVEHPRWRSYVGYLDGQPVAASALLITGAVAGVYWVGTVRKARRRGIGEAMTWHAVREGAAAGCAVATLQASAMGRPVYERMGFRHVTGYRTYARPQ